MGLKAIATGEDPVLNALLSFQSLQDVIKEMAAAVLAQEKRSGNLERSYEDRIQRLEMSFNQSVRLNQELQDRCSTLEKQTESNLKRATERVEHLELQTRNLESAVTEIRGTLERKQAQRLQLLPGHVAAGAARPSVGAGGSAGGGLGEEALISGAELQSIFDGLANLADAVKENSDNISDAKAHLDTIGEHLDETDTSLLSKATKGDVADMWESIHQKADQNKTGRMLEQLDVKLTQTHAEAKRLAKVADQLDITLNDKADLKLVEKKADKDDVKTQFAAKLNRSEFDGVDKRVTRMKNDLQLTTTMIDNLRVLVDECTENMAANTNLVDLLKKQVYQKADLHYTDGAVSQLQRKFRNHDKAIREICRTKADVADVEAIQAPLASIMEGDDAFLAAGKLHYRCLSCDRLGPSIAGPATEKFRQATSPRKENTRPNTSGGSLGGSGGDGRKGGAVSATATPRQPHPPSVTMSSTSGGGAEANQLSASGESIFGMDGRVYHAGNARVAARVTPRRPATAGAGAGGPLWIP